MTAEEFIKGLPDRVSPDALEDKSTCFHFDLSGEGACQLTVVVDDSSVSVLEGLNHNPACVVKGNAGHFMKVVNGEMNAFMALLTGKIKVSNQKELQKYAQIFGLIK